MRFLTQALAVTLAVVGHAFILLAATAETFAFAFASAASVVCLWAAAWLLWRRSMT